LQNFLERAVILSTGAVLHLPKQELSGLFEDATSDVTRTLADAERQHINEVLKQTRGVVGGRYGAAARLGVARTTLMYRMQKLGIQTV
jgi:formate hydrogenlyase transcriptional activator